MGCGLCLDQVELEKDYFKNKNIPYNEYIIFALPYGHIKMHVFLTYIIDNKIYWFEHAYNPYNKIYTFTNKEECFIKVKEYFVLNEKVPKEYMDTLLIKDVTNLLKPGLNVSDLLKIYKSII